MSSKIEAKIQAANLIITSIDNEMDMRPKLSRQMYLQMRKEKWQVTLWKYEQMRDNRKSMLKSLFRIHFNKTT